MDFFAVSERAASFFYSYETNLCAYDLAIKDVDTALVFRPRKTSKDPNLT